MRIARILIAATLIAGAALAAHAQDLVVYHIDNAQNQAVKALRNIRNHITVDPGAKITVVTHAQGVDFLMVGVDGPAGPFAPLVSALKSQGVKFEVCEITLQNRNLKKEQFIEEADFTPSGVVRLAKLQKEGAAYIKP